MSYFFYPQWIRRVVRFPSRGIYICQDVEIRTQDIAFAARCANRLVYVSPFKRRSREIFCCANGLSTKCNNILAKEYLYDVRVLLSLSELIRINFIRIWIRILLDQKQTLK